MIRDQFQYHQSIFETTVGGKSAIDIPHLEIHNLKEAYQFIASYGYDLTDAKDLDKVWAFHRRAVTILRDTLLKEGEKIPDRLTDPSLLHDMAYLFVFASSRDPVDEDLQKWSCAILRVMHVLAHIENDIFGSYSETIQDQIFKQYKDAIVVDSLHGTFLGRKDHLDRLPLKQFDTKPFKASTSSVIKLLTKPHATAWTLMDKVGVRFVTRSIYDSFRVVRFLVEEHLISFPNIVPDQSRNTLYPLNLFFELIGELKDGDKHEEIEARLISKLEQARGRAEFLEKKNEFSDGSYRAIKFIVRQLIKIPGSPDGGRFFYPYEVQIMDYETYLTNMSGESSHGKYKQRQLQAARQRVMPSMKTNP